MSRKLKLKLVTCNIYGVQVQILYISLGLHNIFTSAIQHTFLEPWMIYHEGSLEAFGIGMQHFEHI